MLVVPEPAQRARTVFAAAPADKLMYVVWIQSLDGSLEFAAIDYICDVAYNEGGDKKRERYDLHCFSPAVY